MTLIPPTVEITATGQELTVDGVRMEFQLAPGSEAPAEMHIYLPHLRALCMAENATHVLHNILTIRGALVRDPHAWSRYISEAIELFGDRTDVVFASHHWPTWGHDRAIHFLELQRDLYAYLHDQTVRMMNLGMTGSEIAEAIRMPPALENAWHARGYYGSVSHNVKAVYQRYMGWYDGNPANLWKHPPTEAGCRGGQGVAEVPQSLAPPVLPLLSALPDLLIPVRQPLLRVCGRVREPAAGGGAGIRGCGGGTPAAGKGGAGQHFIRTIVRYHERLAAAGGWLVLSGVGERVRRQLANTGALEVLGAENVFPATRRVGESLQAALHRAEVLQERSAPEQGAV